MTKSVSLTALWRRLRQISPSHKTGTVAVTSLVSLEQILECEWWLLCIFTSGLHVQWFTERWAVEVLPLLCFLLLAVSTGSCINLYCFNPVLETPHSLSSEQTIGTFTLCDQSLDPDTLLFYLCACPGFLRVPTPMLPSVECLPDCLWDAVSHPIDSLACSFGNQVPFTLESCAFLECVKHLD